MKANLPNHPPDDPIAYLHLNQGLVTSKKVVISTILGSCVAVTFYHRPSRLSGIFHASLPSKATFYDVPDSDDGPCRYVDTAIETILNKFLSQGITPGQIETKLFGGAYSLEDLVKTKPEIRQQVDVGRQNVEVARKVLAENNLRVIAEDTLGKQGRRILFSTANGGIWLTYLRGLPADSPDVA